MRKTVIYSVLWMAALLSSCIKEGGLEAESKDTYVQLVISNTASRAGENTAPADPINRLRVYAFNAQGEKIGYLFRDNLNTSEGISLPMPLDKQQSGSEAEAYFYVLANDIDGWGLSETTPCANLDGMSFTRWEDNAVPAVAPMVNNDNSAGKGGYQIEVNLTPTSGSKWVTVNVNIQHIIGRVRLFFQKEGDSHVSINEAIVKHGPDKYRLFDGEELTFEKSQTAEDKFITSTIEITSVNGYQEVGKTYLAPNPYGSKASTGDTYDPAYPENAQNDEGLEYAYILTIKYTIGNVEKSKDVYLPPVSRNQSIDMKGIIRGQQIEFEPIIVEPWGENNIDLE